MDLSVYICIVNIRVYLDTHRDKEESMDPDDVTMPEMRVEMPNTDLPDNLPPASKEFVTLLRSIPSRRVMIRNKDTEVGEVGEVKS